MSDNLVKDIWKEELQRSRDILEIKIKRLQGLPKGSIQPRNRRKGVYYYLYFREGKKVKSVYLGNDSEKISRVRERLAQRKSLEQSILRTKKDIRLLEKAMLLK
ncbi:MAG: hypothetical protein LBT62_02345 [Deltaproteobacteria bacterium]|jgi:hypothetical protein|nr:hypothetical protein [Deltaproteobacteria bacterium]